MGVLTIPYLGVTNKYNVVVGIYRTIADQSTYFKVSSFIQPINLSVTTSRTFVYNDTASDSTIQSSTQIYTTGEIFNSAPPTGAALGSFKNRAFIVDAQNPTNLWYSKQVIQGSPVEFSNAFVQNVGSIGGGIIAVCQMDDKLIIFKAGNILYMVGTGPAASGAGNDFTDPLSIAYDAGCVDRASIVLTPLGLVFKSAKGIYLLDRGLQASYIGAPVEQFNQYNVLASQLISNTTQVRFLLSSGVILVYDYFYKQWSTFTTPSSVADCIYQNQHTLIDSNGVVYQESPGTYVDGSSTPVLMQFSTGQFNLAGINGYQRFRDLLLVGQYVSPNQWNISINYDYGTVSQNALITPSSAAIPLQWRVHTKLQLCQSFQLSAQEINTGTNGAGSTFSGITCGIALKKAMRDVRGAYASGAS
jgi:hypothetical protein